MSGDDHSSPARAIRPAPSDAELATLIVALTTLGNNVSSRPSPTVPARSAWLLAGRRQALLGLRGGPPAGWGRSRRKAAAE